MFSSCPALTDIGNMGINWFNARTNIQWEMFLGDNNIVNPITSAEIPYGWAGY
jgi:hypothetical protein